MPLYTRSGDSKWIIAASLEEADRIWHNATPPITLEGLSSKVEDLASKLDKLLIEVTKLQGLTNPSEPTWG